ncbi:tRNA isopentenyltransferase [Lentinus tigrinus ALCF2SS1-7]|uniref:tRNA isopentenyltransferase n=1 Tax=Lentinus tigrinus ALCF2SS1-6 TaxID=1328759 RepID=A0A5C2SRQ6_9APHY|nr:tRNA isopentenyltransferase [Lentinus tigrinus ALCF2SS1-6]RPD79765.1 tRNA isopentenyltransferase [Lentinus tigrinus ALCF2SS1-7]
MAVIRSSAALGSMSFKPLIVICGTTGVGKSKLGIELALALSSKSARHHHPYHGARIINADSMQVYVGMDVITNKVPTEERCGVEHLLMDYKKPGEQLTGPEWIRDAMQVIDETHARNEVPIVVGGTSYWIQHLIFPERMASLDKSSAEASSTPVSPSPSEAYTNALASLPPELLALFNDLPGIAPIADTNPRLAMDLHRLLGMIDPLVAQRWHWRDSRRVLTNLRIIQENRRLASEIIREQSHTASKPRYRTLCFWLYAKPDALKPRLDDRVDQMITQGLLNEILTLKAIAAAGSSSSPDGAPPTESRPRMDYTLGIYQAIGYKEFHDYLSAAEPSETAFREAVEQMKLGTRRYAKRQVSWLRNKLLPAVNAANAAARAENNSPVVPTYLLDATELGDAWKTNVLDVADDITKAFLEGEALPDPLALSKTASKMLTVPDRPTDPIAVLSAHQRTVCDVCTIDPVQPVMVDASKWEMHVRSRGHRRLTSKRTKGPHVAPEQSVEDGSSSESPGDQSDIEIPWQ